VLSFRVKRFNKLHLADFESVDYLTEDKFENAQHSELETFIKNKRKPLFNQVLFSFIDNKGASDSDIYKRAGIDRRHFSKVRSDPDYRIGKHFG
jgi:hypothetical protein